jgi:hypothetical protein
MADQNIIHLAKHDATHAAWARYQALALRFRDDPSLAADIGFCAEQARAYREWQNLYLGRAA